MKIVISVQGNLGEDNGTTVRVKRIFRILNSTHDTSLIAAMDRKKTVKDKLSPVMKEIISPFYNLFWNLKLLSGILKNKPDVLYSATDFNGFLVCYILSKMYNYKIIFEAHGILSEELRSLGKSALVVWKAALMEKFIVKHADSTIALSKDIFDFYKRYNENIVLIPAFVDMGILKRNTGRRVEYKKKYRIKDNEKLIGLIGPFSSEFNIRHIEFLNDNLDNFKDRIRFIVIGKCNDKPKHPKVIYTDYLETIEEYVCHLSILDGVLVPSNVSSSGPLNKIMEPMACSLPVFTTPQGKKGLNFAENGKDILVFDEANLTDKINELIFDDRSMKKIGENARKTIEEHYSVITNTKKIKDIVERL